MCWIVGFLCVFVFVLVCGVISSAGSSSRLEGCVCAFLPLGCSLDTLARNAFIPRQPNPTSRVQTKPNLSENSLQC